jgi:hypothetical protein
MAGDSSASGAASLTVPPGPPDEPEPGLVDQAESSSRVPGVSAPDAQIQALTDLATTLLGSIRELLAGYERVLVHDRSAPPPAAARRPVIARVHDDPGVTISAGPFASLEAVRAFEETVSRLPGVRDVAVRGYEGSDRAIIEVRLEHAST